MGFIQLKLVASGAYCRVLVCQRFSGLNLRPGIDPETLHNSFLEAFLRASNWDAQKFRGLESRCSFKPLDRKSKDWMQTALIELNVVAHSEDVKPEP